MRQHRRLAASVGLAMLLTTAASTTYAQTSMKPMGGTPSFWCAWFPFLPWCTASDDGGYDGPPSPTATPELDSLLLFGFGLTGLGSYAVTRYRGRRRS